MLLEKKDKLPDKLFALKDEIVPILKKNGIRKAWLFDSVLEKGFEGANDIDTLIDPPERFSLLDLVHMKLEIEEAVGKKADIVVRRSVHPYIEPYIHGVRIL